MCFIGIDILSLGSSFCEKGLNLLLQDNVISLGDFGSGYEFVDAECFSLVGKVDWCILRLRYTLLGALFTWEVEFAHLGFVISLLAAIYVGGGTLSHRDRVLGVLFSVLGNIPHHLGSC